MVPRTNEFKFSTIWSCFILQIEKLIQKKYVPTTLLTNCNPQNLTAIISMILQMMLNNSETVDCLRGLRRH